MLPESSKFLQLLNGTVNKIYFLIDLDSIHNKVSSDYSLKICVSRAVFPMLIVNDFHSTNPYKMSISERSVTCRFCSGIVLIYSISIRYWYT